MVMYLDEDRIRGLLRWDQLIAAMERGPCRFFARPGSAAGTEYADDRRRKAISRHHAGGCRRMRWEPEARQLLPAKCRHRQSDSYWQ